MTPSEWSAAADTEPMLRAALPAASDRKRRLFAAACCRRVEGWLVGEGGRVLEARKDDYRNAVAAAERFADGEATEEELSRAFWGADDSAFCNTSLDGVAAGELRRATFGDDAGWPERLRDEMDDEEWGDMHAGGDPAAWLEARENADVYLSASVDPFRGVAGRDAAEVGETVGRQVLLLARHYGGRGREAEERAAQAGLIREIFGDPFPPRPFDPAWRTPAVAGLAAVIEADRAYDRMPVLADALEEAGCDDEALLGHLRGSGPHARGCWALDAVLGKG